MKIVFFTDAFLPHAGGARVYYYELYRRLAKDFGHHVTIVTSHVDGWHAFDRVESSERFKIVRHGSPLPDWGWKRWPRLVPVFSEAVSRVLVTRPDVIHFGDLFPQGVTCLLMKKLLGLPYLAYCHGEEITQTDLRRYQPAVRDAIYGNAGTVIATSDFARDNLLRIGVAPERIAKINPGVDCDRFYPEPRDRRLAERLRLGDGPVLMTVARLVPRKGQMLVLRALARILPEIPDAQYVIAGTGPEEDRLREAALALGVAHAVRFAGFVPDAELPAYYNLCDVFVLPNYTEASTGDTEGFGIVFLEANACGKPVIAGIDGGTAESVHHGVSGLRVDPMNIAALAEALTSVLSDRDMRTRLGENGRIRVRKSFSWDQSAAVMDERLKRTSLAPSAAAPRPVSGQLV